MSFKGRIIKVNKKFKVTIRNDNKAYDSTFTLTPAELRSLEKKIKEARKE